MKVFRNLGIALLLTACSSELPHESPFDALSPFEKQAKGQVTGSLRLEGESDHSQITVQLQSAERTYSVDTDADGAVKLTGVVPGTYQLSIRTRYFQPISDTVQVALGEDFSLGTRELALNRATVFGSALSQSAGDAIKGGVALSLIKKASIRTSAGAASAPRFRSMADQVTEVTYSTVSSSSGQYQFPDVPAGRYDIMAAGDEGIEVKQGEAIVTGEGDLRIENIVLKPLTGFFEIIGKANGGESSAYTTTATVKLHLTANNAQKMKIAESTDGTAANCPLANATPVIYAGEIDFTFIHGPGRKLLCVQYIDLEGKETSPIFGSIIYDNAPPYPVNVFPITVNGFSKSQSILVNLSAVDDFAGVSAYTVAGNETAAVTAIRQPFQSTIQVNFPGQATQTTYLRVFDAAGNYSAAFTISVIIDTQPPVVSSSSLETLAGAPINDHDVTRENRLVLRSSVVDDSALEMQVSTTGTFAGVAWEPYNRTKVIDLVGTNTTIQAQVRDQAGFVSELLGGITVTLDNTVPVVSFARTSPSPAKSLDVAFTLTADETAKFQVSEDANFAATTWLDSAPGNLTLAPGEGFRTLYARAKDEAGNISETKSITVVVDTVVPLVSKISVDEGSYASTSTIHLTLFATGADTMKIAEISDLSAVVAQPYATVTAFELSEPDAAKTVYVEFQDLAGNVSATYPVSVTLDRVAPGAPTVVLNNADLWANNRLVSVAVTSEVSAVEMQVSEDPLFGNAAWQPFNGSFSYTLQSVNDGSKQLLVRVRDLAGNVSIAGSASIKVDTTPPTDAFIGKATSPFDYANNPIVLVNLGASAADFMRVSTDGTFDTELWEAMSASRAVTVSATDGLKTVYAQFRDKAYNQSQIVQASFFLDTQAPEAGTLSFAQGSYSNQREVLLLLSASGADFYQIGTTTTTLAAQPRQQIQPGRPISLPDADGLHTYYVRFLDRAENVSAIVSASVLLDRAAPVAGGTPIVLNNGNDYTQQSFVAVTLDVAGATEMQMRNQPFFDNGGWEPVTTSTTWFLENGDGPKKVWVRFRDAAGNVTPAYSDSIVLDQRAPDVSRVVLNNGQDYTNSLSLTLRSEARDVVEMRYGTDASFSTGSGWVAFQATRSVAIAAGDGVKTIYAQFRDAALNTSAIFSDSITLDQTEPQSPAIALNGGAAFTREPSGQVQLTLSASDELSGIAGMQLSNINNSFPAAVSSPYVVARNWNIDTLSDGEKSVWVRYYDRAGNYSAPVSDTIVLDRAAPSLTSLVIDGGAVYATTNIVTVTLAASDLNGVAEMKLSTTANFGDGFWQPFTTSTTFVLPAIDGNRFVFAKFRDAAGNEGGAASDDIQLDTRAPQFDNIKAPQITSNNVVSVQLFAPPAPNAVEMRLSEDADFTSATWEPYANSANFSLSVGDGDKTIYAQLRDAAGLTSVVRSVLVSYDTTGPDVPAVRIRQGGNVSNVNIDVEIFADGATAVVLSQDPLYTGASTLPFSQVKPFVLTGGDGLKTIYVKVKDAAGNYSADTTAYTVLDRAVPTFGATSISINSGEPSTNSSFVTLVFDVTGATELQVGNDGGFGGASWVPYSSTRPHTLSQGDGLKTVYARFRDAAGNIAGPVDDSITLDTKAPSNPFIGAANSVTKEADVAVTLSASDADQMMVSLSPTFALASWESYSTNKTVTLTGLDGSKTIYAKFRRQASGYETPVVSVGVMLDRAGPTDAFAELSSAVTHVTSTSVGLRLSAVDSLSGIESVEISESPIFFDKDVVSMRSVANYTLRVASENYHPIYVRYLDRAGNYSNPVTLGVIYDVTPPVGSIQVAGGAERINSQFVTVVLASADADVRTVRIANDSAAESEFNYSAGLIWAIRPIQDVPTSVNVRFVDIAGNASPVYSDIVTYDTSPPVVSSFNLQMEVSTTALTLEWAPSFAPGIASYNWYRHLDGVKTLGGTVASSVTGVTVLAPLTGEEYSVAAVYTDGLESALSAAAVENGAFNPAKGILLVDDAAGATSVVTNLKPVLNGAGFTYDTLTVAAGSDGPAASVLKNYQVVVWSSGEGPTAPTLSAFDRDSLKTYLSAGGNLVYLGSDAAADNDTATFLKRWIHTGRVETNLPAIERLYVEAGDIGGPAGMNFPVGPAIESAEGIFASALSDDFLASGKPLAVRYPRSGTSASYRASWIGLPTRGLYDRHVFTFNTDLIDLPVTGATLRLLDNTPLQDVNSDAVQLDLPFDFQLGAIKTDKIWVSSNGNISFQGPVPGMPYPVFPTTDTITYPGGIIAALWAKHEPAGEIFYTASATEVTIVWKDRPITNYTFVDGGGMGVVTATTTSGIVLRSDYEFVMVSEGADWIGQLPHVEKDFMDESGLGFEAPRQTAFDNCCDSDSPAIAVTNYRGVIPEAIDWMGRLVRWSAAPAGVKRIAPRSFEITSNVAGATQMRVSIDGALDTEGWITYDPNLPVTGFTGDGSKTVQVVFVDEAGNITATYTDTENLDTDAPGISTVLLTDSGSGSNAYTRNRTVTLQVLGSATNVDFMRVSESRVFVNAGWVPYVESSTFTLSEGDGAKFVHVWLRDPNGNVSAPAVGSIQLDGDSPSTKASGDTVARQAPMFINTAYTELTDTATWASVAGMGTDTQAQLSYLRAVDMNFSFPFYGRGYSRIIIYPSGVVQIGNLDVSGEEPMPLDDDYTTDQVFIGMPSVAPFFSREVAYTEPQHGVFYEEGANWALIRWAAKDSRTLTDINVALLLFADGSIKFLYGDGNLDGDPVVGVSRGDGRNFAYSTYDHSAILDNAASVQFTPNPHDDAKVKLYYRYRYPSGPGAWVDSGVQANSVYDAMAFYPPSGAGTYEFYTVGIDEAGNIEVAPAEADLTVIFDDQRPVAPTNLTATADEDAVFVQWEPSVSPDVAGYKVYYGSDANLDGSDASEGDSPIEVPNLTEIKLTNLEAGAPLFVSVTAVDRVGNESSRPSGVTFMLPRELRVITTFNLGSAVSHPQMLDDSLFVHVSSSGTELTQWLDVRVPQIPQLLTVATGGETTFVLNAHVYTGTEKLDIWNYGAFMANGFILDEQIEFIAPDRFIYSSYESPYTWQTNNLAGTNWQAENGHFGGLFAEGNEVYIIKIPDCPWPMTCSSWELHSYTYDDLGNETRNGVVYSLSGSPHSFSQQSGMLALARFDNPPTIELLDVSDPLNITSLAVFEDVPHANIRWVGDRLVGMDPGELTFYDIGDLQKPVIESIVDVEIGTPNDIVVNGAIGYATGDKGTAVVEFGELLPFSVTGRENSVPGDIRAIVSAGRYIYVSDDSSLYIYSADNLEGGKPGILGTYTPFSANNILVSGQYLYAVSNNSVSVYDVSDPMHPMLVGQHIDSHDSGSNSWTIPVAIVGTTLITAGRAFDVSDPLNPYELYDVWQHRFSTFRGDGRYIYSANWENGNIQVWSPGTDGLRLVSTYASPVTNVEDMALDNNILYLYQVSHPPCCSGGPAWAQLTIMDVSNPAALTQVAAYQVAPPSGGGNGSRMLAKRGFVYMLEQKPMSPNISLIQIDMRNPYAPAIALRISDNNFGSLQPPIAITPDNYVLVNTGRAFDALRITSNVPVYESVADGTAGAKHVVHGGRYVYYAGDNWIKQVERRAAALELDLVGSGEVALTKKGLKLQLFDPPGVPAVALTNDGTGTIDLTAAQYDTAQELCDALDASGRISCILIVPPGMPSADLLDAYGMRLKGGQAVSLRMQKINKSRDFPIGTKISGLEFAEDRLFATVEDSAPERGLYVIDPQTMLETHHYSLSGNRPALSLVVSGTHAYIGTKGAIVSYDWANQSLGAGVIANPDLDIRFMDANHDSLFYMDDNTNSSFSPTGPVIKKATGVLGGSLSINPRWHLLVSDTFKGVTALSSNWAVAATDGGVEFFKWDLGNVNSHYYSNIEYDYVSSVNGKVLLGKGNRLEIIDTSTLPLDTVIERSIFVQGNIRDVSVHADMLSVAAGAGGGVMYRLK